jgi:hypothetical protein
MLVLAVLGPLIAIWVAYVTAAAIFLDHAIALRATKWLIDAKLRPLMRPDRPAYLVVVSGSNGLYSIDSAALGRAANMPVANAALQWSYTLYMLDRVAEDARAGDVVLLPIEYQYFTTVGDQPALEACYAIMQDRSRLRGTLDFVATLMRCSPQLTLDALAAQVVSIFGIRIPTTEPSEIIDSFGDILENKAGTNLWKTPTTATVASLPAGHGIQNRRLGAAIGLLVARGARVFLSYPAYPEKIGDFPLVPAGWTDAYRRWAESLGARVISTPEAHLFPVGCFYDSPYHLHRGCSARNSEIYARALRSELH